MPFQPDQPNTSAQSGFIPDPPTPSTLDSVMTGVNKGAMKTVYNLGDLVRRGEHGVVGMLPQDVQDYLNSAPDSVKNFIGYSDQRPLQDPSLQANLTPTNTPEKLGYGAETAAENLPLAGAALRGGAALGRGLVAVGDRTLGASTVNAIAKGAGMGAGAAAGHAAGVPGMLGAGYVGRAVAGKLLSMARGAAPAAEEAGASASAATAPATADVVQGILPARAGAAEVVEGILPPETVPTVGNPFQAAARMTKSNKAARFLHQGGEGIHSSDVANFTPEQWELAAKGAGVTKLSKASQKATMDWLQQYERFTEFRRAQSATPPPAPPPVPPGLNQ